MDVKRNFEERWQKLTTSRETIMTDLYLTRYENKLRYKRFDKRISFLLIKINFIPIIICITERVMNLMRELMQQVITIGQFRC